VPKLTLTQRRLVDRVISKEITQVEAAKKANVSTKTIGRWVTAVRAAQGRAVAS
jgi:transposase